MDWLFESGYRNILIEVNNECNVRAWDHEILRDPHVHALISYVRAKEKDGYSFLTGTSYGGGAIPSAEVVEASDFVLIHGNGVREPERITVMVQQVKALPTYTTKPILFNEGYQSVPVDWRISSARKKGFFNLVKEITGGNP